MRSIPCATARGASCVFGTFTNPHWTSRTTSRPCTTRPPRGFDEPNDPLDTHQRRDDPAAAPDHAAERESRAASGRGRAVDRRASARQVDAIGLSRALSRNAGCVYLPMNLGVQTRSLVAAE